MGIRDEAAVAAVMERNGINPNEAKPPRDVLEIVAEYLRLHEFDGLFSDSGECACLVSEGLAPCGEIGGTCVPGYRLEGCIPDNCGAGGGCDFHIVPEKPSA